MTVSRLIVPTPPSLPAGAEWDELRYWLDINVPLLNELVQPKIRAGLQGLTWAGVTLSNNVFGIPHGLGVVPRGIVGSGIAAPAAAQVPICNFFNFNAQTFDMNADMRIAYTGNQTMSWVAFA